MRWSLEDSLVTRPFSVKSMQPLRFFLLFYSPSLPLFSLCHTTTHWLKQFP